MTHSYTKFNRLFISAPLAAGNVLTASPEHYHYLVHVLRLAPGDMIRVYNGQEGEWLARLASPSKKMLTLTIEAALRSQPPAYERWLVFSPLKPTPLAWMMEKATELGVTHFLPWISERCNARQFNAEKWQKVVIEAAEQSERLTVPHITPPCTLNQLAAALPHATQAQPLLLCDETWEGWSIKESMHHIPTPLGIIIGPEGGLTDQERALLPQLLPIQRVHLGPTILRAETAALTALAFLHSG